MMLRRRRWTVFLTYFSSALLVGAVAADVTERTGGDRATTAVTSSSLRKAPRAPPPCDYHADNATAAVSTAIHDPDEIRDRIAELVVELNEAAAACSVTRQVRHRLELLEREKYGYMKDASEDVLKLVNTIDHVHKTMIADTNRDQRIVRHRHLAYSKRSSSNKSEVLRRILEAAEVGLKRMQIARKLQ